MKLSVAISDYLQARTVDGFAETTLEAYRLQFSLLLRAIGDQELDAVTTVQLRDYLSTLGHLKPASLSHRIRALHALWNWLVDEEYTVHNPTRKIRERLESVRVPKALSIDELEVLRDACQSAREHALLELFFATGARLAEVQRLNRRDIHPQTRSAIVLGKGNKEREVYWGAKATMWLDRYLAGRTDEDPALFVTVRRPYRRAHRHTLYQEIKRIAKRAGMADKVWPHVLRHTLATSLLNNGADLTIVQSVLGHQKPSTTLIYAHLSGKRRRQDYDRYFVQ